MCWSTCRSASVVASNKVNVCWSVGGLSSSLAAEIAGAPDMANPAPAIAMTPSTRRSKRPAGGRVRAAGAAGAAGAAAEMGEVLAVVERARRQGEGTQWLVVYWDEREYRRWDRRRAAVLAGDAAMLCGVCDDGRTRFASSCSCLAGGWKGGDKLIMDLCINGAGVGGYQLSSQHQCIAALPR